MSEWFRTRDWPHVFEAAAFMGCILALAHGRIILGVFLFFVFIGILGRKRS